MIPAVVVVASEHAPNWRTIKIAISFELSAVERSPSCSGVSWTGDTLGATQIPKKMKPKLNQNPSRTIRGFRHKLVTANLAPVTKTARDSFAQKTYTKSISRKSLLPFWSTANLCVSCSWSCWSHRTWASFQSCRAPGRRLEQPVVSTCQTQLRRYIEILNNSRMDEYHHSRPWRSSSH